MNSDFYRDLIDMTETMDMPIEGLHTETGPGVLEAALAVDEALAMADKAMLFKCFTKALAQRNGLMATFMAKWSHNEPGQSGHIHMSLRERESGKSAFHDESRPHNMSVVQEHFIAGVQQFLPEFMSMYGQTVNSYSRLVPGYWAPLDATWGVENRTTALRLIPGTEKSQRVEVRIGSADANPYIALAAALGAGLHGIEHKLKLQPIVTGNAYAAVSRSSEAAQLAMGRGAAPARIGSGARAVRRGVRRAFRGHARVGGAPVPPSCDGLGAQALFRNHLGSSRRETVMKKQLTTISPIDGSLYVQRDLATDTQIAQALTHAHAVRRTGPGSRSRIASGS